MNAQTILTFLASGLGAMILTEAITYLTKYLKGTLLAGDAAWILSGIVAVVIGIVTVGFGGLSIIDPASLLIWLAAVWAASQAVFKTVKALVPNILAS